MIRRLINLLLIGKWTDCAHTEMQPGRGYHEVCACGVDMGRKVL